MLRVSVAMCTYNGAAYLSEQLASIQRQTVLPWEMIVCDDCSTDRTIGLVQEFSRTASFPVRIVSNEATLGSTNNFEKCIGMCRGDVIALADQDDIWMPNKLETLSKMLEQDNTIGAIFSNAELIDSKSRAIGGDSWSGFLFTRSRQTTLKRGNAASVLLQTPIVTGATVMFRSTLRTAAFPIPEPWLHDAWIAWIAVLSSKIMLSEECLTKYRLHETQQLGLPTISRKDLLFAWGPQGILRQERERERSRYEHFAEAYTSLYQFAEERQLGTKDVRALIMEKARFSEFLVGNLSRPRLIRLWRSLFYLREFGDFTPHRRMTIFRHTAL
jgi:glycosyltransferase involved in cell wall biosynthesis